MTFYRHGQRPAAALGLVLLAFAAAGCSDLPSESGDQQLMTPEAQSLLQQGSAALQEHAFVQALAYADSAEALQPGLADVPFLKGRIYSELAQLDKADSLYRIAVGIRPGYPGVWHNLGNTAFRQQEYSEAISYYRREIELHGEAQPWRGIGRSYVELGRTDSARAAFERALEIDSTFAQAHFSLALLLEDLGDLDGALAAAESALRHGPDNPEYRYSAASLLVRLGRPDEAVAPLLAVIEEWPWHQGAHYNVAQALMRLGRTEEARQYQDRAEELRDLQAQISHHEGTVRVLPEDPNAHAGLGTLLRRAGRYNDAMHAYRVALFLDPENLDYRHNMAVVHLLRRDTTAAIRTFEQILTVDPSRVHTWINLGSLYAMSGLEENAREAWTHALRLEPDNQMARRSLARLNP